MLGISWDREFNLQESLLAATTNVVNQDVQQDSKQGPVGEADELARTAGLLLENIKHEQNPKFKQSQFLGLMKQLRDGEVRVEGDKMVESDGQYSSQVDVKGKGRALESTSRSVSEILSEAYSQSLGADTTRQEDQQGQQVDPNDAYFRQDNEEFTRYWNDLQARQQHHQQLGESAESRSWDRLQDDWDRFEATTTGIKPINNYQFQLNNPYLLGDSSRTRTHTLHTYERQSVLEVRA